MSIKETHQSLLVRMNSDLEKAEYEKTILAKAFELFNKKFVEEPDPNNIVTVSVGVDPFQTQRRGIWQNV